MPTTYSQIPIRCRLSIVSNPPAYPIDDNTGEMPRFWRGQDVAVQVGIFNALNSAVDLSNITELLLTIRQDSTSPYAYTSTISGTIIPTISYSSWAAGTAQQATFDLTQAMTDLPLDGAQSAVLWMSITGYTATGNQLVYGAGPITVYNPGAYAPPVPVVIVGEQDVTNSSGNTTVILTNQVNTVRVAVTGDARTSNIVLSRTSMIDGSTVRVAFALPATPSINLVLRDDSVTGTILGTIITDGVQPNAVVDLVYNGSVWLVTAASYPAF